MSSEEESAPVKKKEIYTWNAPWTDGVTTTMAWCDDQDKFKIAVGSYMEEYSNQLSIIQLQDNDEGDDEDNNCNTGTSTGGASDADTDRNFKQLSEVEHPYPATNIMWAPRQLSEQSNSGSGASGVGSKELLATTGDYLRLWSCNEDNKIEMVSVLNNNKHTEYCAPLTSFDWNEADPSIIGTY